ncbi:MAG: hypothetical protein WCY88_18100 [Spongiibacteraceae bacterium]
MNIGDLIFATCMGGFFLCMVLYVFFGQITVRKLRKNPATKDKLGLELTSGWDILNVAGALSSPEWLRDRFSTSRFSGLTANYQLLYENTSKFDRVLARVFWFFYVVPVVLMLIFIVLNSFGLFE